MRILSFILAVFSFVFNAISLLRSRSVGNWFIIDPHSRRLVCASVFAAGTTATAAIITWSGYDIRIAVLLGLLGGLVSVLCLPAGLYLRAIQLREEHILDGAPVAQSVEISAASGLPHIDPLATTALPLISSVIGPLLVGLLPAIMDNVGSPLTSFDRMASREVWRQEAEVQQKTAQVQQQAAAKVQELEVEVQQKTAEVQQKTAEVQRQGAAKVQELETEIQQKTAEVQQLTAEAQQKTAEVQQQGVEPTSSEPVYNAVAEPNGGEPNILLDHVPTRIFFNLGPLRMSNMVTEPKISDRLRDLVNREGTIELAVTMTCNVCANVLPQTLKILYFSPSKTSTAAVFEIIPDLARARSRKVSSITFSIDRNGTEFDFLNIPVRVQRFDEGGTKAGGLRSGLECKPSFTNLEEPGSDLVIRVKPADGALWVSFAAPNPELAVRLDKRQIGDTGLPKWFRTGARSPGDVTLMAGQTYYHLRALVEQNPKLRSQLPIVSKLDPQTQYVFDSKSKKMAVKTLYKLGVNMYDTLFYSGGPDLSSILNSIEKYGNEKHDLRILVYAEATYLPWQLLHAKQAPGTPPDANQFWGNKYVLGVIPTDPERDCGRLPGAMKLPATEAGALLYAHYWNAPDRRKGPAEGIDAVSCMGQMFGDTLSAKLANSARIVHTKSDFRNEMQAKHLKLLILWSYTHGHSGAAFLSVHGQQLQSSEVAGQRLDFSKSEFISAYEIKTDTISDMGSAFFAGRPFVFLNGCETGTQGGRGTTDFSLPGVFLMRGARGVVATEAPVWDFFGYQFGEFFLNELAAGRGAGEAMLATRREFLKYNNPLGLIYTYYGNPAVRIESAVTETPKGTSGGEKRDVRDDPVFRNNHVGRPSP